MFSDQTHQSGENHGMAKGLSALFMVATVSVFRRAFEVDVYCFLVDVDPVSDHWLSSLQKV